MWLNCRVLDLSEVLLEARRGDDFEDPSGLTGSLRIVEPRDVLRSEADLRTLYAEPSPRSRDKQIAHIDDHCRDFIARAPLIVMATSGPDGSLDVSPKGGPPGFVRVLDHNTIAFGDLAGNNRLDSLTNLVAASGIGLLFMIPGLDETLRVNGRARITTDPSVLDACELDNVRPRTALVIDVEEAFIHCAKAFKRAQAWQPSAWPDRSGMPSIGSMLRDHANMTEVSGEDIDKALEASYGRTLWQPGGQPPGQ